MSVTLDTAYNEATELRASWETIYAVLTHGSYDVNAARPAIDSTSTENLNRRIILTFELFESLKPLHTDDINYILLSSRAVELNSILRTLRKNLPPLLEAVRSRLGTGTRISDQNGNFTLLFETPSVEASTADVSSHFTQIHSATTNLLTLLSGLLGLCKATSVSDVLDRANALANIAASASKYLESTETALKKSEAAVAQSIAFEKQLEEKATEAEGIRSKLELTQQETEKARAGITSLIEQIKTTGASASTLEKQVADYRATFDAFQKSLDDRNKSLAEFEQNAKTAFEKNQAREIEMDRLTQKADTMIRGSTTAGLSKSLEDARSAYATRMFVAGIGFLVSIAILAISAAPLAAHLLPGLFGTFIPGISESAQNAPIGILGKIVLLLPGAWLAAFFTKSFSEFFHLEREYAHKAALAKAVEGFKREAPKFEQEITAAVFGEILNNPSSRKGPEPVNHPLYEALTKRIEEWLSPRK